MCLSSPRAVVRHVRRVRARCTVIFPCEIVSLVVIGGDPISDSLRRGREQKFEYHHY